jgi:hypothetical protein
MNGFSLLLLFILCTFYATAQAVEIGDKDWRQLTDTIGITYNDLASIYDVPTGRLLDESRHMLGNIDFSGWTWATAQDVYEMYSFIVGKTLESYDYYYEENPSWLSPFFNDLFEYTDRSNSEIANSEIGVASGIGRDGVNESRVIVMKVWIGVEYTTSIRYFGGVDTRAVSKDGSSIENEIQYGAHMYRTLSKEKSKDKSKAWLQKPLAFFTR